MRFYGNSNCEVKCSPGTVLIEDSFAISVSSMNYLRENIQKWLERIKMDMLNPVEKHFIDSSIQEFRSEIENKLGEMEDGYFTKEEGEQLREKLEQMEDMILDRESQEELKSEMV